MVGRIAKFLRRQTPEPPEVTEAIAQLAHLAETQADLRQAAALQSALLRAMYAAPAAVLPVAMTAEDAVARLDGEPQGPEQGLLPPIQEGAGPGAGLRPCW